FGLEWTLQNWVEEAQKEHIDSPLKLEKIATETLKAGPVTIHCGLDYQKKRCFVVSLVGLIGGHFRRADKAIEFGQKLALWLRRKNLHPTTIKDAQNIKWDKTVAPNPDDKEAGPPDNAKRFPPEALALVGITLQKRRQKNPVGKSIQVTIPHKLAGYLYDELEVIADNIESEYSPEDAQAAHALRLALENAVEDSVPANVEITPAIRAMLLEGWHGTDVLDSAVNTAYSAWDAYEEESDARIVKRQASALRRKLTEDGQKRRQKNPEPVAPPPRSNLVLAQAKYETMDGYFSSGDFLTIPTQYTGTIMQTVAQRVGMNAQAVKKFVWGSNDLQFANHMFDKKRVATEIYERLKDKLVKELKPLLNAVWHE
ncbi:hypothetical protein EBU99_15230, partial [bacterium]|nr:hypothetical protein [bacterium]